MTEEDVKIMQGWSLNKKIDHSLAVIEDFHAKLNGKVYVSFSGGKDSTVLYWLAQKVFPDMKAVFCNTRNEYPEIVQFVLKMKKDGKNIDIVLPKLKPHEIVELYGFPLISKQTSDLIDAYRNKPETNRAKRAIDNNTRTSVRVANKYRYLLTAPYECSAKCCELLKKKPMHEYDLKNGVSPILGTMACESTMRFTAYVRAGQCNTYNNRDKRKQKSRPLSIWLEQDIWDCINKYNIEICDIYNKGFNRTGCACCGFGAQFNGDNRFQYAYDEHPNLYHYFMSFTNNGTTYREALRDVLRVNKMQLPDEYAANTLF